MSDAARQYTRNLMLAVCFVVAMGGVASAEEQAWSKGTGSAPCGKFAELYRSAPDQTELATLSWALGYISGINSLNEDVFFDLNAKTLDEMKRYLRQYCNDHPLAYVADGVRALKDTLPAVQRNK